MKKTFLFILISFTFLMTLPALGQGFTRRVKDKRLTITGTLGSSSYFGDLASNTPTDNFGANFSVGLRKSIYPRISLGLEVGVISLSGNDVHKNRGHSFKSINYEVVGLIEVSLFRDPSLLYKRRLVNPYVNFGVGALYFQPKATLNGVTYNLIDFETNGEKYSPVTVILPLGAGVKFKVSDQLDLALEFGFRTTFTDNLDDVSVSGYPSWNFFNKFGEEATTARLLSYGSKRYAIIDELINSGALNASQDIDTSIIQPRGNAEKQDFYMLTMVRAYYYLPSSGNSKSKRKRGFVKRRRRFR